MPGMKTARSSILGWILVPLLLALVATYLLAGALLRDSLAADIDAELTQEAQELQVLAERATDPESGQAYTSAKDVLELFIRRSVPDKSETLFVLVNGVVTERSSAPDVPRLDQDAELVANVKLITEPLISSYQFEDEAVRYIVIPVSGLGDQGHLVAAMFTEDKLEQVNRTLAQLAVLMLLAFGAAIAAGWFVAGRILMPIRQLGDLTRRITDGTTVERLTGFDERNEIGAIASDFNSMLDRTASAFAAQRRFVEDAGHELKTPLTIVRGHLDLIKSSPTETNTSMPIIQDEVQRMTRIVQDLQLLTKSNESSFIRTERTDPSEVIDEVFVKSTPLATRNWQIQVESLPEMELDRQRFVQALLQLVDNAIKHTTEKDSILIGLRSANGQTEFFVADSGPGIPEQDRQRVKERFVRGGWTAQDTEGSGLGLAIVDAIARGHKGSLFIGSSNLGGAEVGIRLKKSDEPQLKELS